MPTSLLNYNEFKYQHTSGRHRCLLAILEFKKHSSNQKYPNLEDQTLSNYYPTPDGRKYDRLSLLGKQLRNSVDTVVKHC